MAKQTPHAIIAEPVIQALKEAIERGDNGRWVPPWRSATQGLPLRHNGEPYSGINTFLLALSASTQGFQSQYWFTFKEAKRRGWCVRKGEKSTAICFYKSYQAKTDDGEKEERRVMRYYRVFNGSQIDGIDDKYIAKPEPGPNVVDNFDAIDIIKRAGVRVETGMGHACYIPSADEINLPDPEDFTSQSGFNGTALHELTHATGHKSRLNRNFSGRFGDAAYATEELVAEFGATILCATYGMEYRLEHHASYLEHWYRVLKNNPSILAAAGAAATRAAQWILDAQQETERAA